MVFGLGKENFFLDLEDGSAPQKPVVLAAPQEKEPAAEQKPEVTPVKATVGTASTSVSNATAEPARETNSTQPAAVLTTAEAIAAELAAAEASRPVVTMTTFAPDNLMPGRGLARRRRRPGANMKGFKTIASELFKN